MAAVILSAQQEHNWEFNFRKRVLPSLASTHAIVKTRQTFNTYYRICDNDTDGIDMIRQMQNRIKKEYTLKFNNNGAMPGQHLAKYVGPKGGDHEDLTMFKKVAPVEDLFTILYKYHVTGTRLHLSQMNLIKQVHAEYANISRIVCFAFIHSCPHCNAVGHNCEASFEVMEHYNNFFPDNEDDEDEGVMVNVEDEETMESENEDAAESVDEDDNRSDHDGAMQQNAKSTVTPSIVVVDHAGQAVPTDKRVPLATDNVPLMATKHRSVPTSTRSLTGGVCYGDLIKARAAQVQQEEDECLEDVAVPPNVVKEMQSQRKRHLPSTHKKTSHKKATPTTSEVLVKSVGRASVRLRNKMK